MIVGKSGGITPWDIFILGFFKQDFLAYLVYFLKNNY